MFVMMNAARLQVGVQGVAIAERAFQQALAYTQERRQGRAAFSSEQPGTIFDHPDVRRTLMLMKAKIEAARGICLTTGVLVNLSRFADDEQGCAAARARQELLTPIAKAWSTDMGVEVASAGLQLHGGMGYIEETGAAQHYRDARIAPTYEGSNAIQAIDLIGRKLKGDGGAAMRSLCNDIRATVERLSSKPSLVGVGKRLGEGVSASERATEWVLACDIVEGLAAAGGYLKLAGDVVGGWILARQAIAALGSDDPWLVSKGALARIYASEVLAQAPGVAEGLMDGRADLQSMTADLLTA